MVARPAASEWRTLPVAHEGGAAVHRVKLALLSVPVALLLAAAPVAADTTGGGNGTAFSTGNEVCQTSGSRLVCTDTSLFVQPNGDGTSSTCLDIFSYSNSTNGRQSFVSDTFGCADGANLTIGSDYSVTVGATEIPMQTCKAHKRQCSGSTVATASAAQSLVGSVSITTSKSTTVQGSCTYKTTSQDTNGQTAGTITVGSSTLDAQGGFDIFSSTTTVRCK
jgi:hypothetical protein